MIVEHAVLQVKHGRSAEFEQAMREAKALIGASSGFHSIEVRPAVEAEDRYLLRVVWSDVAAHRDGFRKSDRYQEWRALLHAFYEPLPTVEYFGESII